MSFAMSSLWDVLGIPSTRAPMGVTTFVSYVIPSVACYIVAAVLAITPQTRALRIAICPVVALLALRAAVSVDVSFGKPDHEALNGELLRYMLSIAVHSLSWAMAKKPLVRYLRPSHTSPSTITDALDLASNFRGLGWDWSRGLHVPRDTRPTDRMAFVSYTLVSAGVHNVMGGIIYRALNTFIEGVGPRPTVSTIFDDSLPLPVRYLRAAALSALACFGINTNMQMVYDFGAVTGVLVFQQDPSQWPPVFDSPWRATSLSEFWGRRWHQSMRHMFIVTAYPLHVLFGRTGGIIGAFLSSALTHHLLLLMINDRTEMWRMLVGFGMMAPGMLAERAYYKWTGKRVGGSVGSVWTMAWLLLWGSVIVDGFARGGLFFGSSAVDNNSPLRPLVEKVVVAVDAWLHTI